MTPEQALLQLMAEMQMRINALQQKLAQVSEENKALTKQISDTSGGN